MASDIYNIVVDCADPFPLAEFWSAVLERPVHPDNVPGDEEVGIPLSDDVRADEGELLFIRVPEPKAVKNRLHICLRPRQSRDDEVSRVVGLGATVVDDRRESDGAGWAVLTDPEGNEFCVLRSRAERAAAAQA